MASVCYACHEPVRPPVCVGCGALQPPAVALDPFELLGLERRYHLDPTAMESAYRGIARKVHPDRFVSRPAVERRMALLWTAAVNEARRILRDDRLRARFLATGQAAPRERGGPALDPTFLAEIFDWRERDEEEPGVMAALARQSRDALLQEVDDLFTAWEAGRGSLELVDDRLARLNYLDGLVGRALD